MVERKKVDPNHPKAIAAAQAQKSAKEAKELRLHEVERLKQSGIGFFAIPPNKAAGISGMAVAYKQDSVANGNVLRVSTCLMCKGDRFDPATGKLIAANRLRAGNHILLRKPNGVPAHEYIDALFTGIATLS